VDIRKKKTAAEEDLLQIGSRYAGLMGGRNLNRMEANIFIPPTFCASPGPDWRPFSRRRSSSFAWGPLL